MDVHLGGLQFGDVEERIDDAAQASDVGAGGCENVLLFVVQGADGVVQEQS